MEWLPNILIGLNIGLVILVIGVLAYHGRITRAGIIIWVYSIFTIIWLATPTLALMSVVPVDALTSDQYMSKNERVFMWTLDSFLYVSALGKVSYIIANIVVALTSVLLYKWLKSRYL